MTEGFFKSASCCLKIHQCGFTPGNDIDIKVRKLLPATPENFPDIALKPVTNYCTADFFADRNPQARLIFVIGQPYKQKTFDCELVRWIKKPEKFGALPQSGFLWKRAANGFMIIESWITWLQCGQTDFCGLWPFYVWSQGGHFWLTFWPESRGYACVRYCSAEMFFSYHSLQIKFFRKWVFNHTTLCLSSNLLIVLEWLVSYLPWKTGHALVIFSSLKVPELSDK